jgi:hypothetical protein
MNHKRGKPKAARAGCLLCKPHKFTGVDKPSVQRVLQPAEDLAPGENLTDCVVCEDPNFMHDPDYECCECGKCEQCRVGGDCLHEETHVPVAYFEPMPVTVQELLKRKAS